jgi:hypothetical protein
MPENIQEIVPHLVKQFYLPIKDYERISEGYHYSEHEKEIHGLDLHGGVDYQAPRGTHVPRTLAMRLAPTTLFWSRMNAHPDLSQKVGQPIYSEYCHLDSIERDIPFYPPYRFNEGFHPRGHKLDPELLMLRAKPVRTGEVLGTVGDSGLCWGYEDYPHRPNCQKCPSWDEVHLHFGVFARIGYKKKKLYIDPYGLYAKYRSYAHPQQHHQSHKTLFN